MLLMGLGHVGAVGGVPAWRVIPQMGGDPLAAMVELDEGGADPGAHDFVDEPVRDGIVVAVDLDVGVDVDAGDLPLAVDERLGGQRAQGELIEALEERAAAGAVQAHRPRVQVGAQLGDARIEGGEGEEGLMAKPRQDPSLGHQHARAGRMAVP